MNVCILSYTEKPKEVIFSAARQCYSKHSAKSIFQGLENVTSKELREFVLHLKEVGHLSPLEHVSFTFAIEGVSRTCTHQLVRHRIASYSQQSQRYVAMDEFAYIIPPSIQKRKRICEKFIAAMEYIKASYRECKEELKKENTLDREAMNQDLRFLLPQAVETKIVVTMNIRELLHFFEERLCTRAQWEIRSVAQKMHKACGKILPEVFSKTGAKCVRLGYCPEGKRGCGLYPSRHS